MTALHEQTVNLITLAVSEINIEHNNWLQDPTGPVPAGLVDAAEILSTLTAAISKAVRA